MGLTNWWLARSEASGSDSSGKTKAATASTSSMFKWPLRRVKSEPRKTPQQHFKLAALNVVVKTPPPQATTTTTTTLALSPRARAFPQDAVAPEAPEAPSSSSSSLSSRLNLRVLSASVTQAKDYLHQYASSVTLCPSLAPLTVPCVTKSLVISTTDEPESEPSPTKFAYFPSEELLQYETNLHGLVANGLLDTKLTSDGCGGAYFLYDTTASSSSSSKECLGIFKPREEEYMAPHNPRGYVQEHAVVGVTDHPVNKGFRVGNGALRERAAYLLDAKYGHFSGVPMTTLLSLPVVSNNQQNSHAKEGSVQSFVASECSAEDMGSLKFSVPEVHKIGILDVRLFNTDRHAGNILLHKPTTSTMNEGTYNMTPIDHGFCLPSFQHLENATFDWLQWPQAQFPFTSLELDHIASLESEKDAQVLRSVGIEEDAVVTMRICTALLQSGAEEGFSLYEIGSHLQREGDFSQPSTIEKLVVDAMATVGEVLPLGEGNVSEEYGNALVEEATKQIVEMWASQQPKKKVRSISCFS